jgi:hypothetical protein
MLLCTPHPHPHPAPHPVPAPGFHVATEAGEEDEDEEAAAAAAAAKASKKKKDKKKDMSSLFAALEGGEEPAASADAGEAGTLLGPRGGEAVLKGSGHLLHSAKGW